MVSLVYYHQVCHLHWGCQGIPCYQNESCCTCWIPVCAFAFPFVHPVHSVRNEVQDHAFLVAHMWPVTWGKGESLAQFATRANAIRQFFFLINFLAIWNASICTPNAQVIQPTSTASIVQKSIEFQKKLISEHVRLWGFGSIFNFENFTQVIKPQIIPPTPTSSVQKINFMIFNLEGLRQCLE